MAPLTEGRLRHSESRCYGSHLLPPETKSRRHQLIAPPVHSAQPQLFEVEQVKLALICCLAICKDPSVNSGSGSGKGKGKGLQGSPERQYQTVSHGLTDGLPGPILVSTISHH